MTAPIPIALCGQTEAIGESVVAGLQPDIEVVHFVMGQEAAIRELPLVLQGTAPEGQSSAIGSGNFASAARAVVLGGAYDEESVEAIRAACVGVPGARAVPWLRQDTTKPTPPLGPEYGKAMVRRTLEALRRLEKEGKLDGSDDGVHLY